MDVSDRSWLAAGFYGCPPPMRPQICPILEIAFHISFRGSHEDLSILRTLLVCHWWAPRWVLVCGRYEAAE